MDTRRWNATDVYINHFVLDLEPTPVSGQFAISSPDYIFVAVITTNRECIRPLLSCCSSYENTIANIEGVSEMQNIS